MVCILSQLVRDASGEIVTITTTTLTRRPLLLLALPANNALVPQPNKQRGPAARQRASGARGRCSGGGGAGALFLPRARPRRPCSWWARPPLPGPSRQHQQQLVLASTTVLFLAAGEGERGRGAAAPVAARARAVLPGGRGGWWAGCVVAGGRAAGARPVVRSEERRLYHR